MVPYLSNILGRENRGISQIELFFFLDFHKTSVNEYSEGGIFMHLTLA